MIDDEASLPTDAPALADEPDLSFLAPPDQVRDWRQVLAFEAAASTGVLDALPGTAPATAGALGLEPQAVRAVLDVLTMWDVVTADTDGVFRVGAGGPSAEEAAVLRLHARALRQWSGWWAGRENVGGAGGFPVPLFLRALAPGARRSAPAVIDACGVVTPGGRALDLGGGHGEYALELARRGLQVTLQDHPPVVEALLAEGRLAGAGVDLFAGDLFEALPEGPFDLVFCAGVTDTYGEDRVRTLLERVRPIVADGGRLALMSFLRGHHPVAVFFAAQVAVMGSSGDAHTEQEYADWLTAARFRLDQVIEVEGGRHTVLLASTTPERATGSRTPIGTR